MTICNNKWHRKSRVASLEYEIAFIVQFIFKYWYSKNVGPKVYPKYTPSIIPENIHSIVKDSLIPDIFKDSYLQNRP